METKNLSLFHLIREAQNGEDAPPLLLLLHGVGSNEKDLFGLAPLLDKRFLIISVRAPNTQRRGSYAWYEVTFTPQGPINNSAQAEASREALIRFINEATTAYGADPKKVYLMGFSQGAIMSASVALTRPDLVAGTVMMSGRVLQEVQSQIAPAEQLQGQPFLVVHGTADTVLPIHHARATQSLLSSLPVELSYHEYRMGHEITQESLNEISTWLSSQL